MTIAEFVQYYGVIPDVKVKKSYLSEAVQVLFLLLQVPLTLLNELLH